MAEEEAGMMKTKSIGPGGRNGIGSNSSNNSGNDLFRSDSKMPDQGDKVDLEEGSVRFGGKKNGNLNSFSVLKKKNEERKKKNEQTNKN